MITKTHLCYLIISTAASSIAFSADISYSGQTGTGVNEWRTNTVAKPSDIDGDNVYGTAGYAFFATSTAPQGFTQAFGIDPVTYDDQGLTTLTANPSFASFSTDEASEVIGADFYFSMDDPTSSGDTSAGWGGKAFTTSAGTQNSLFELTFSSAPVGGSGVRLGLMRMGLIDGAPTNYIVFDTSAPGSGATIAYDTTLQAGFQSNIDFFDITNISAGDVISIGGTAASSSFLLTGITLDVIPVPESSTTALIFGTAVLAAAGNRRKHS